MRQAGNDCTAIGCGGEPHLKPKQTAQDGGLPNWSLRRDCDPELEPSRSSSWALYDGRGNRVLGRLRTASETATNYFPAISEPPSAEVRLGGVLAPVSCPTGHLNHPEHRPRRPLTRVETSCLLGLSQFLAHRIKSLGTLFR